MPQELPIHTDDIKAEHLLNDIPEFYALRGVVENSRSWHKNDSVFDHTLRAIDRLDEYLGQASDKINSYLSQKVGRYSRRDLLYLGLLLHDIGKEDTLTVVDGFTRTPDHETVGAEKAAPILSRFGLTEKESDFVTHLIKHHMATFFVVTPGNSQLEEQVAEIRAQHPEVFTELILLSMADTLGTQLDQTNPYEFNFRIQYYKGVLDNI